MKVLSSEVRVQKEDGAYFSPVIESTRDIASANDQTLMDTCIGELFVRGAIPELIVKDHTILKGVDRLYICNGDGASVRSFTGTALAHLLQMKGSSPSFFLGLGRDQPQTPIKLFSFRIERGGTAPAVTLTIMAAVPMEHGLIILDGTGLMTGHFRYAGNAYDREKFHTNLLDYLEAVRGSSSVP